jgi:hypothetical protein
MIQSYKILNLLALCAIRAHKLFKMIYKILCSSNYLFRVILYYESTIRNENILSLKVT